MKKKQKRAAIMATRYEVPALQLMLYWEAVFRFQRCPCYLRHISNLTQASFNSRFLLKDYFQNQPPPSTANNKPLLFGTDRAGNNTACLRSDFQESDLLVFPWGSLACEHGKRWQKASPYGHKRGKLRMLCDSKETLLWKYGIIVP